jgi:hypothetical protein
VDGRERVLRTVQYDQRGLMSVGHAVHNLKIKSCRSSWRLELRQLDGYYHVSPLSTPYLHLDKTPTVKLICSPQKGVFRTRKSCLYRRTDGRARLPQAHFRNTRGRKLPPPEPYPKYSGCPGRETPLFNTAWDRDPANPPRPCFAPYLLYYIDPILLDETVQDH